MDYLQVPKISKCLSFDTPQRESFFMSTSTTSNEDNDVILGKGSYGIVYNAKYKKKNVAVKVINKEDDFKYDSLKRESNILSWRHENIIRVFKIVDTVDYGAIIMEQFENAKPLQYILDNCVQRKVDLVHRLRILRDIASALEYCHLHEVCHADLKPLNIMIVVPDGKSQNYICKLFDFGCSFKTDINDKNNNEGSAQMLGTVRYCAPEMLQGNGKITNSVDIYSFGILMWQLKENEIPFESIKSNDVIIWQVVKNNLRPDSTILLLSELNEKISTREKLSRNHQYCKSIDTLKVSPKLNTPTKACSTNLKTSRTEVMKKRNVNQESRYRRDKLKSRKNLFVESLKVVQDEIEVSTPKCFQNLFVDEDLHLRVHEKLFHIENSYIKLYKACWHEDFEFRPSTEKVLNDIQQYLSNCLE